MNKTKPTSKRSSTKTLSTARGKDDKEAFFDRVVDQIRSEHKIGMDFVRSKRDLMRERLRLYQNLRKQKNKVGINTLFTVMNTLLSISYQDSLAVTFRGRELGDEKRARNLEHLAMFDYDEMDMASISYLKDWDRLFFGVGIRSISAWDRDRNVPIVKSHDPLSFIPDPQGSLKASNFRFMGFEVAMTKDEMTAKKGFFNIDKINDADAKDNEAEASRVSYRDVQGLSNTDEKVLGDNALYDLVDWYTVVDGRKCLVTLANKVNLVVRFEEIKPATDAEKKNPSLIPFPIILNYYSPLRNDPFGTSVADLVEDKQRAQSVLANLRIASEKSRLYPMYLYDRSKIMSRKDLDFSFNKAIAVTGDITKAVIPVPRDMVSSENTLKNERSLDDHIRESVGADKLQTGMMSEKKRTLGEIREVQSNAQVRHLFNQRIDAWGEKQFWMLWYRMYKRYFSEANKKVVRIAGVAGANYLSFSRSDFIGTKDPDIVIVSKIEKELQRKNDRLAFSSIYPIITNDPELPHVSKNFARRHLLELHNVSRMEARIMAPPTMDEARAEDENELLSRGNEVVISSSDDHLSHDLIHSYIEQTSWVIKHREEHRKLYEESGEKKENKEIGKKLETGKDKRIASQAQSQIAAMAAKGQ